MTKTCIMHGFADVRFTVEYEIDGYDSTSAVDDATICECSECGNAVLVPPAFHHYLRCDDDLVWQEYRHCPICGARIAEVR